MTDIKAIVLRTAGTNCDLETVHAIETAGALAERVHIQQLIENEKDLADYHFMVIPGGFSYGDDIAAGRVLANEISCRLAKPLDVFLRNGGIALGICNGFQVLVKMGLLPLNVQDPAQQQFSLLDNDCGVFVDRWVNLAVDPRRCVFLSDDEPVELPVAHAEGKFAAIDNGMIDELFENGQVVFRYTDKNGADASYPDNPNGSYRGVAGVCDKSGRVLGMMPHPERFIEGHSHPRHTREGLREQGDGLRVFTGAVEYLRNNVL